VPSRAPGRLVAWDQAKVIELAKRLDAATAAREILNPLAPYYDPDFAPLQPGRR
jgi:hypothetical protein